MSGIRPGAVRALYFRIEDACKRALVWLRWRFRGLLPQRPHGLDAGLVVTLTSHPSRFATLRPTLLCLLSQSVRPDRVILWVAHADRARLPSPVADLVRSGLEIRACEDLRSYKKLVPALRRFPESYLVTADDDTYYWRGWLAGLIAAHKDTGHIICHRAHRIRRDRTGSRPASYGLWEANVGPAPAHDDIFPTTGGGVLYPPGALDMRAVQADLFQKLSPDADDLWFYFMSRMAGRLVIKTGRRRAFRPWIGSQETALYAGNSDPATGNDAKLKQLISAFGWPPRA